MRSPLLARCAVLFGYLFLIAPAPVHPTPAQAALIHPTLTLAGGFPAQATPDQAQTPSADEVISRHIEAIGGQAAIDAIQTMKYERIYVHIEEERIYHRLVHKKRPGRSRNCAVDTGSCFIVNGNRSWTKTVNPDDGSVGWSEDEYLGSQSSNFEGMRLGPFINYREKGITVEILDTLTVEGLPMHHLKMEMANGEHWDIFFGVETGLWSRYITPGGGTVTIHDYRPVGDILFPRLTEVKGTRRDGTPAHHLNTIISVELNVPLDDSLFRPDSPMQ